MYVYSAGMIFYVIQRRQHPNKDVHRNKIEVTRYCQQTIHTNLKHLSLNCVDHDPHKRSQMLEVRNTLQELLNKRAAAKIAQDVATVSKIYKCRTFFDNISDFEPLTDVANF